MNLRRQDWTCGHLLGRQMVRRLSPCPSPIIGASGQVAWAMGGTQCLTQSSLRCFRCHLSCGDIAVVTDCCSVFEGFATQRPRERQTSLFATGVLAVDAHAMSVLSPFSGFLERCQWAQSVCLGHATRGLRSSRTKVLPFLCRCMSDPSQCRPLLRHPIWVCQVGRNDNLDMHDNNDINRLCPDTFALVVVSALVCAKEHDRRRADICQDFDSTSTSTSMRLEGPVSKKTPWMHQSDPITDGGCENTEIIWEPSKRQGDPVVLQGGRPPP